MVRRLVEVNSLCSWNYWTMTKLRHAWGLWTLSSYPHLGEPSPELGYGPYAGNGPLGIFNRRTTEY